VAVAAAVTAAAVVARVDLEQVRLLLVVQQLRLRSAPAGRLILQLEGLTVKILYLVQSLLQAAVVAVLGMALKVLALVAVQVVPAAVITQYKQAALEIHHQLLPLKALTVVLMVVTTQTNVAVAVAVHLQLAVLVLVLLGAVTAALVHRQA
jgi:hypothetical protein